MCWPFRQIDELIAALPKVELHVHLAAAQLVELARNGVRTSFLDAAAKAALLGEIDRATVST